MKKMHDYQVGNEIYLPSKFYIGHGADDFRGGLCRIEEIEIKTVQGEEVRFIRVAERPGSWTNLKMLIRSQDKLKKEFGDHRGYMDPEEGTNPIPEPF